MNGVVGVQSYTRMRIRSKSIFWRHDSPQNYFPSAFVVAHYSNRSMTSRNSFRIRLPRHSQSQISIPSSQSQWYTNSSIWRHKKEPIIITKTIPSNTTTTNTNSSSTTTNTTTTTNTNTNTTTTRFIPRKAALQLTNEARSFLKSLLTNTIQSNHDIVGIGLNYQMSKGTMKMVFQFDFIKQGQIGPQDEGVSLEVLEDGTPKPPQESQEDGIPKLYIQSNAFLKVLGGKLHVKFLEDGSFLPILYDREGNLLDPNA